MPNLSPKGSLPFGWIVKRSSHYRDKVYYFNINTGDSTWECPELDPPRVLSDDESGKETDLDLKNSDPSSNRLNPENPPQMTEAFLKSTTPPTAVVVPVYHKKRDMTEIDTPVRSKKRKKDDAKVIYPKSDIPEKSNPKSDIPEKSNPKSDVLILKSKKKKKKKKKKSAQNKNVSPLKEGTSTPETNLTARDIKKLPKTILNKSNVDDLCSGESSKETAVKDVEMLDVSMDIIHDLTEKKETTVFDTTCYYIVVDTNVFIRELHLINELKDTPLDSCGPPHIFIPWVVIEELDKLKSPRRDSKGAPRAACEAIRYLNSVLRNHPRFHGQSPAEAEEWAKTYSKCNDDKILECCIALMDKMPPEKVILLTNDKNLVNKALICNVNVHNFESMMKKVKPDTVFNYEEMKINKRKKEKNFQDSTDSKEISELSLTSKRDSSKCEIHAIMSNARLLLKNVLFSFFSEEMEEAYGDIWLKFDIDTKLLKGLLDGIKRYWRAVFSQFFLEKEKRNFELLLEKASRPEGFLGDKDECLIILSAIEDAFRQIKKRRPKLKVPTGEIQDYRVACVNAYISYNETESYIRTVEEQSLRDILNRNWNVINQLCGIVLDHYGVPHDFNYEKLNQVLDDFNIRTIMTVFYPGVQTFRNLFKSIYEAVQKAKPIKKLIKRLAAALLDFIPSLKLTCEPVNYPFFSQKALEIFLTSPQNRQMLEVGVKQIEKFYSKLEEGLSIMLKPRKSVPDMETMICD